VTETKRGLMKEPG